MLPSRERSRAAQLLTAKAGVTVASRSRHSVSEASEPSMMRLRNSGTVLSTSSVWRLNELRERKRSNAQDSLG